MTFLTGNKIRLRAIEPSDIDLLYQWENNTSVWQVSNTITPFSRDILKKYIETSHLDIFESKQLRLIIELIPSENHNAEVIGAIDLFDFDPRHQRAGVGILIHDQKNRNNGFATESLKLLIEYAFGCLLLHQLYCNISPDNEQSLNLFKKNGFTIIGNKKEWIRGAAVWKDEYMLQLINN